MSIGFKGLTKLQNEIDWLRNYVLSHHPLPQEYHVYNSCVGKGCSYPAEYPAPDSGKWQIKTNRIPIAPASILINFEWQNPEVPESPIETWCCCFTYAETVTGHSGQEVPGIVNIESEDCTSDDCEECHDCVITTPAPGGTLSFITGGEGSGTVDCTTSDAFNDSWNNMSISIVHATTGVVAATYLGPPIGLSPQTETPLTLDNDTEYGIYINSKGEYPQENTIDIQQDGGVLLNHTFPTAEGGISDCSWAEAPGGEVLGCTDPEALNYDPAATVDDGSCEY